MNKKEMTEIRRNFSDDCGHFTINRVLTAFIDDEKNIKSRDVQNYNLIEQEKSELIMAILRKITSGKIGKTLLEYNFSGERQKCFLNILRNRFSNNEITDKFLDLIVKNTGLSNCAVFAADCTYTVCGRGDISSDYNFIITAFCPVDMRIDELIYDKFENLFNTKDRFDNIVELPSHGFIYPTFSNRQTDVNTVMYYTKNAKKPDSSIICDLLQCDFNGSASEQKNTFWSIIRNLKSTLDVDTIMEIKQAIDLIAFENINETSPTMLDAESLRNILDPIGIDCEQLPAIYYDLCGNSKLRVDSLTDEKMEFKSSEFSLKLNPDTCFVKTKIIDGIKYLAIPFDDNLTVNGIDIT